ncbi:MAG: Na+/H+ antiporter subunit E [Actinomycetota bacterium]|nr:Na+/H+ antiporter subunit E [Actinomycetota bacterium]
MGRLVLPLVLLTLVYALVLGSFYPADLALGAILSGVLLYVLHPFVLPGGTRSRGVFGRVVGFFPFAAAVARDVAVGTWEVTLVTLHARPLGRSGIVAIPVGERSELGVAVSALVATLSPGEVLVDLDRGRGVMLIHVIDAADPEEIRRRHEDFYRRYQRRVFP